ncbi:hypothetical protein P7B02_12670 [Caulobacter segnis]|uniref:hypothetical protein n=1 Tax=Caulobacter segnis TaxID=88688 RepID=UPI00240FDE4A|nr:hypothetical protein [Caulobacter segnis]MDG2522399.1 hypothetical protein [Caulobacter segnis]
MSRNRQRKPGPPTTEELEQKLARDLADLEEMLNIALALYPPVRGEPRMPRTPSLPKLKPFSGPVTKAREQEVHAFTKLVIAMVREQRGMLPLKPQSPPY